MAYEYKELKDANGTAFKAAAENVETSPNDVWASIVLIDPQSLESLATGAKQDAGNASLSSIDGKTPSKGQAAKTGCTPVTLASDEDFIKAEDAAHSSGDKGVMFLAVRKDSAVALAGADGDYIPLIVDANGRLHVLDANSATIAALSKAEDVAHSSGDTGIQVLAVRKDTAEEMAGTAGDYAPLEVDALGRLHVCCHWPEQLDPGNDGVDVKKMTKGTVTVAHNAITATATSAEIDCRGYNSLLVHFTSSASDKEWVLSITGAMVTGGAFVPLIAAGSAVSSMTTSISGYFVISNIPDFIKITATENGDGATVTVTVQPFNA